jgi:phosphatidylglycerophosphatase C
MNQTSTGTEAQPLAVFDLDGTLTTRDSFLPFLVTYAWRQRRLVPLLLLPFYLAAYLCRLLSDRAAKQGLLVCFCRHASRDALREHAAWFCRTWLPRHLHPTGVAKLREHQQAGHRVVLLSASPSLYVPAIAEYLGISETVCTCVQFEDGVCTGAIVGPNCKGPFKVTLLREYLRTEAAPGNSFAYGDSSSDLPILNWVRQGYLLAKNKGFVTPGRTAAPCEIPRLR